MQAEHGGADVGRDAGGGSPATRATITVNASGTVHAAGCAMSVAGQPGSGGPEHGDQHRADRRAAAGQHAGRGARRRSARATRCRAPAAGRSSTRRPRTPARPPARRPARRRAAPAPTGTTAGDARWPAGSRVPSRGRSTSVESTPATLVSRPDEVDRNAANAPAATSAASSRPASAAAERRLGQQQHHRVGLAASSAAAGCRSGRARRTGWAAGRTAPTSASTTRVVRRAAAPSGLV